MNVNENYWTIRAEAVPKEEEQLGPGDRIIHVCHIVPPKPTADAAAPNTNSAGGNNNGAAGVGGAMAAAPAGQQPTVFGDPFLLRIGAEETLGQVGACGAGAVVQQDWQADSTSF